MHVGKLIEIVKSLPDYYLGAGISHVDSWRGSYDEPAFEIQDETTKEEMLEVISECLSRQFDGYKGGTYFYDESSTVNFDAYGVYTDGSYLLKKAVEFSDSDFIQKLVEAY